MSQSNDRDQIVPTARQGLSKHSSSLVRRGLDQLSKPKKSKGRVLVIADEELILEVTQRLLTEAEYEVRCARKPLEVIGFAKSFQPDLALVGPSCLLSKSFDSAESFPGCYPTRRS